MTFARILIPVLAACLVGACSMFDLESGSPLPDTANSYRPGCVTYKQVLADLGPPHRVTPVAGGFAFLYEHHEVREGQLTVTFATLASPFVDHVEGEYAPGSTLGLGFSRADGRSHVAVLTFDDSGLLRGAHASRREAEMGSQKGISWLISPQPMSVMGALRETKPESRWGGRLLRPLPLQINERQDPTSGPYGFEQTGTPRGAGQRSSVQSRPLTSREQKLLKKGKLTTK